MSNIKNQSILQKILIGKNHKSLGLKDLDMPLLFVTISLVFFGIIMITSVSLPLTSGSFSMTLSHIQKFLLLQLLH